MPKVRRCTQKSESTDSDSDWSSENAEKQNISRALRKSNKINRWARMMNGSGNIFCFINQIFINRKMRYLRENVFREVKLCQLFINSFFMHVFC